MSYLGWFISIILAAIVVIVQAIDKEELRKEHKEEIERADKYNEATRNGLEKVIKWQEKCNLRLESIITRMNLAIEKYEQDIETQIKLREQAEDAKVA
jgi:hypothetical protein